MIKEVLHLQNSYKVNSNSQTGDIKFRQWLKIETYDRSDCSLNAFNEQLKRLRYPYLLKENKDIFGWLTKALKEMLDREEHDRKTFRVMI